MIDAEKMGFDTRGRGGDTNIFYKKIFGRYVLVYTYKNRPFGFYFKCSKGCDGYKGVGIQFQIFTFYATIYIYGKNTVNIRGNYPETYISIMRVKK